jgi:hypothetical protein
MNAEEAAAIAERERGPREVPAAAERQPAEPRWIEVAERDGDGPWRVRDVLVWVVRFAVRISWIDLLIADATGRVVRVDKSRGYVLRQDGPPRERP